MSALGQKWTFASQKVVSALPLYSDHESVFSQTVRSALPSKADMCGATRDVGSGP